MRKASPTESAVSTNLIFEDFQKYGEIPDECLSEPDDKNYPVLSVAVMTKRGLNKNDSTPGVVEIRRWEN